MIFDGFVRFKGHNEAVVGHEADNLWCAQTDLMEKWEIDRELIHIHERQPVPENPRDIMAKMAEWGDYQAIADTVLCMECQHTYRKGEPHTCAQRPKPPIRTEKPWATERPDYYTLKLPSWGIYKGYVYYDVMDIIEAAGLNFERGSAVKYILRAGRKPNNPVLADLKKARECLDREIKFLERG